MQILELTLLLASIIFSTGRNILSKAISQISVKNKAFYLLQG